MGYIRLLDVCRCLVGSGLFVVATSLPAVAVDEPVISISEKGPVPRSVEVHVGELVRWRAPAGGTVRLEMDPHLGAHEVVSREMMTAAILLAPGVHSYTVSFSGREVRGEIIVREVKDPIVLPPVCGPGISFHICIQP